MGTFDFFVGIICGSIFSASAEKMVLAWIGRDAEAVKAMGRVSSAAHLKALDPSLSLYFAKQNEFIGYISQLRQLSNAPEPDASTVHNLLFQIRNCPFFEDRYRPEYDIAYILTSINAPSCPAEVYTKILDEDLQELAKKLLDRSCKEDKIDIRDGLRLLLFKMRD